MAQGPKAQGPTSQEQDPHDPTTQDLADDDPTGRRASVPGDVVRLRLAVGAVYAAQGFGYATVVTALPGLKARTGIDDTMISVVLLVGALLAASGSVVAERVARRWSSRAAVVLGLLAQAVGLALVAAATSVPPLVGAFVVFALGLGMVDAASNMQGVALQQRAGRSILSTLFACLTVAAITAALVQSGLGRLGTTGAVVALALAVVVAAAVALAVRTTLLPTTSSGGHPVPDAPLPDAPLPEGPVPGARAGVEVGPAADAPARTPLPRAGIWLFGALVAVAFVVDAAVSSWSTVYLSDDLGASATLAPLGYAAYQGAVLLARLSGDALVRRHGRARFAAPAAAATVVGLVVVALVPSPAAAIGGFALAGIGAGALVPLAFSAAGELAPRRLDDVVARINLFNYGGALVGSVSLGLLSPLVGLGPAFVVPAFLLLAASPVIARLGAPPRAEARRVAGRTGT